MKFIFAFVLLLLASPKIFAEPMALATPSGVLHGTLETPRVEQKIPWPVVLIIAGSGPTDRNGNTTVLAGANNSLQYLAEALAANGIASLRYDKRGVGQSARVGGAEEELRFENLIDDAVAWGKSLRGDKRFSTLTILGHSEGSLIGMVAARRLAADGFVSVAGIASPAGEVLLEQLGPQLTPDLMKKSEGIIGALNKGETLALVPAELNALFRPSVQPYLISWFRFDPRVEIKKLSQPILVLQGTTDIQVGVENAKLLAAVKPNAKLVIVEGMNHVLKLVGTDRAKQLASYSDATLPIAPELAEAVCEWVRGIKKRANAFNEPGA